jgi:hypothetical protein
MMKRVLGVTIGLVALAMLAGALYLFIPPKVEAEWDTSPDTRVIVVGYLGEVDYNYIPDAQVWGDGHIIWVEHDTHDNRQVLEGYLSKGEMTKLINQLIDAGFFRGCRRFNWRFPGFGEYVGVSLSNVHHQVVIDPISEYDNKQVLELVDLLKSGAGAKGTAFVPTAGTLLAYPLETTDFPQDAEASYQWPDDEFGYGLEEVYTNKPHNERRITGEELKFAWRIVNSPAPLVQSRGGVYWIAVVIPGVSF